METFNADRLKSGVYRSVIAQKGGSVEMDRYIYSLEGEGLGGWFGAHLKTTIPVTVKPIKASGRAAKSYTKPVGREFLAATAKRGVREVAKRIAHKPQKKRRRSRL